MSANIMIGVSEKGLQNNIAQIFSSICASFKIMDLFYCLLGGGTLWHL
jgi:hypothetical protein